jgi:NinB protein
MTASTFTLPANPVEAHKILSGPVWHQVKAMAMAGHRLELVVRPAKRSAEHNARLHAMLGWLSNNVPWSGELRSVDHWKRLTTAAWLRARGESVEYLPALDGKGIDIVFRHTAEMSGKDIADMIEWIHFWAAEMGHDLPEYSRDPNTGQLVEVRRVRVAA